MDMTSPAIAILLFEPFGVVPMAEQTMPTIDKSRFQKGSQHPKSAKMPKMSPAIAALLFFMGIVSYTTAFAGGGVYGCPWLYAWFWADV